MQSSDNCMLTEAKTSNEENFTPSVKLTAEQEKEADFVLESNLGEFAYLVGRYLQKQCSVQYNVCPIYCKCKS